MSFADLMKAEPASGSGASNVWLTPRYILEALGPFDLDPASCPGWETAKRHYYEKDNGLYLDWDGLVWLNPPYGVECKHWVERWCQHKNGFLLVAARPDSSWFHRAAKTADLCWFPKGRINFLGSTDREAFHPAFASVIFAAGPEATRRLNKMGGVIWSAKQSAPQVEKETK